MGDAEGGYIRTCSPVQSALPHLSKTQPDHYNQLTKERSFHIVSPMDQDAQHLAKLQDYYAAHGVLPPYSTVMTLLGFK